MKTFSRAGLCLEIWRDLFQDPLRLTRSPFGRIGTAYGVSYPRSVAPTMSDESDYVPSGSGGESDDDVEMVSAARLPQAQAANDAHVPSASARPRAASGAVPAASAGVGVTQKPGATARPSRRMHRWSVQRLCTVVLDYIALQGGAGAVVAELFDAPGLLCMLPCGYPRIDDATRVFVFKHLRRRSDLSFLDVRLPLGAWDLRAQC